MPKCQQEMLSPPRRGERSGRRWSGSPRRRAGRQASPKCPALSATSPLPNQVASSVDGRLRSARPRRRAHDRDPNAGHGLRGDTLTATGKAEAFGGRCLDAYPSKRERQQFGEPLAHCLAVRADTRSLANQGQVDIFNHAVWRLPRGGVHDQTNLPESAPAQRASEGGK